MESYTQYTTRKHDNYRCLQWTNETQKRATWWWQCKTEWHRTPENQVDKYHIGVRGSTLQEARAPSLNTHDHLDNTWKAAYSMTWLKNKKNTFSVAAIHRTTSKSNGDCSKLTCITVLRLRSVSIVVQHQGRGIASQWKIVQIAFTGSRMHRDRAGRRWVAPTAKPSGAGDGQSWSRLWSIDLLQRSSVRARA